jgi:hypothetical protein
MFPPHYHDANAAPEKLLRRVPATGVGEDGCNRAGSAALRAGFRGFSWSLAHPSPLDFTQVRWREGSSERRRGCIIEPEAALAGVAGVSSGDLRLHGVRKGGGVGFIGEGAMDFRSALCPHNGDGIDRRRASCPIILTRTLRLAVTWGVPISLVSGIKAATR